MTTPAAAYPDNAPRARRRVSAGWGGLKTLLFPLQESEILVEGEVVVYKERKHLASVVPEIFTGTMLLFVLFVIMFGVSPTTDVGYAFVGFTFVFAAWYVWGLLRNRTKPVLYGIGAIGFFLYQSMGLEGIASLAFIVVAVRMVSHVLLAYYRNIYLTNRRVLMAESPLSRNISSVATGRITDISIKQSFWGGMLGYSHLKVETAGQDQALNMIDFLKYPDEFYQSLVKLSTNEADLDKYFESE